ncbi:MAG: T9SS type A sorting domain-containing protein [Bacteroidia bacterium]|nr:T9SS type A sorting domain-containing protein [Bacteroidia bacterium]
MKIVSFFLAFMLISVFAFAQNGITCFTIPNSIFPVGANTSINSQISEDTSGNILICSVGAGLITFDGINYSSFTTNNSGIASNNITAVAVDSATNTYFIATSDSGLSVFNGNTWVNFNTSNSGIASNKLTCLKVKNNIAYLGSSAGLSIYNAGTILNYTVNNSTLQCDTILSLECDNLGNLWIGSTKGLLNFDGVNFSSVSAFNNQVISAVCFADNYLWISAQEIFRMQNNSIKSIGEIFYTPAQITLFSNNLAKGPNDGLLISTKQGFCEIVNGKQKFYSNYNNSCSYYTLQFFFSKKRNKIILKSMAKNFAFFNDTLVNPFYNYWLNSSCYANSRYLDVNQVKAGISNRSTQFYIQDSNYYEVPKGSHKLAMLANSLWIGGKDSSQILHLAAQTYGNNYFGIDFWPGPLDTLTGESDTATALKYDRLWLVSKFDIEQFKYKFQNGDVQAGTFVPTEDILNWPARGSGNYTRNMAPFVDVNHDGNYNPLNDGDYPKIKGDQMAYWIFNDNLDYHSSSFGIPLKIEVHAAAYSFACSNLQNRDSIINYTTFYSYQIFNRSKFNYDSTYISSWSDLEIGNPVDDIIGTNAQNNFVYACNFDSVDDGNNNNHYGLYPPVVSNVILNGPLAYLNDSIDNDNDGALDEIGERNLLTNSMIHHKGPFQNCSPENDIQSYLLMQAKWRNGSPLTYGGTGYFTGNPTKFMYPDFPSNPQGWSSPYLWEYERVNASSGPFLFPAGSSFDYDFALVFSRDTTLTFNSPAYYNMAVNDVQKVKSWFDNNNAPSCLPIFPGITEQSTQTNNLLLFPNPSNNSIQIQFNNSSIITDLSIYDVMGKCIMESNPRAQAKSVVKIDVIKFSPGVYIVSAKDAKGTIHHKKFIRE